MSSRCEIERKFLVRRPLPSMDGRGDHIEQGYIATGETEVRLRRRGDRCSLTCKRGLGEIRIEHEVEISPIQFEALWPMTQGCRVEKDRFTIEHEGYEIDIDIYVGFERPLVVAEVEFENEEACRNFSPPYFFGREITNEHHYKNQFLAREGLPAESA